MKGRTMKERLGRLKIMKGRIIKCRTMKKCRMKGRTAEDVVE